MLPGRFNSSARAFNYPVPSKMSNPVGLIPASPGSLYLLKSGCLRMSDASPMWPLNPVERAVQVVEPLVDQLG